MCFSQCVKFENHYRSYCYNYFPHSSAKRKGNQFSTYLDCKTVIKDPLSASTLYMDL